MSALRLMCDTNILLDIYTHRMHDNQSEKLLTMHVFGDAELWASPHSFPDLFYILRKKASSAAIYRAVQNSLSWLNVCSVGSQEIESALASRWPDFEDCIVSKCAEKIRADFIVTRDKKGFLQSDTPALSPGELFDLIEAKHGLTYDEVTL